MKFTIVGRPEFRFRLTAPQLAVLMRLSAHHYDGHCRSVSQIGGFLYGWQNTLGVFQMEEVSGNFAALDTCLKLIEMAQHYLPTVEEREAARALGRAFNAVMNAAPRWEQEVECS